MLSKEKKTNFNMSYAELIVVSHQNYGTIMRDISEFERFGITISEVEALKSQAEELVNTPKDEELQGVVMDITIAKNELVEQSKTLIREIATFVKLGNDKTSGIYNALGIDRLARKKNDELHRTAAGVVRLVRLKTDRLPAEVQNVANELELVSNQLLQMIRDKHFAIQDRDLATHERVDLANSLYAKFSKLSTLGQAIWAERNEAKYNDYIIYSNSYSPSAKPKKPDSGGDSAESEEGGLQ